MNGELPPYFLVLVVGLLAGLGGMLSAFPETRAVRSMQSWPFRVGIPIVRFQERLSFFPSSTNPTTLTQSAEVRVVSPSELLFVPQGWRSHLSWSFVRQRASPYSLKGLAVSDHRGTEIVGRLSLAATFSIPGMMLWLGGAAFLGLREHPGMSAILLIAGVLLPAGLTWATLPAEIARCRTMWQEVRQFLEQESLAPVEARGGPTRSIWTPPVK